MQANATKFHYKHFSKDTYTDFQCEGINIKSEDMVKMLGINIHTYIDYIHIHYIHTLHTYIHTYIYTYIT